MEFIMLSLKWKVKPHIDIGWSLELHIINLIINEVTLDQKEIAELTGSTEERGSIHFIHSQTQKKKTKKMKFYNKIFLETSNSNLLCSISECFMLNWLHMHEKNKGLRMV